MPNTTSQNTDTRPLLCAPTLHECYFGTTLQGEPIFLSNFLADFLMEEMTKGSGVAIVVNPKDELIKQFEQESTKVVYG